MRTTRNLALAACLTAALGVGLAAPATAENNTADAAETAAARVAVGDTAPDFTVEAIDGSTYALGQLRGGEKHLVLVFFRGAW